MAPSISAWPIQFPSVRDATGAPPRTCPAAINLPLTADRHIVGIHLYRADMCVHSTQRITLLCASLAVLTEGASASDSSVKNQRGGAQMDAARRWLLTHGWPLLDERQGGWDGTGAGLAGWPAKEGSATVAVALKLIAFRITRCKCITTHNKRPRGMKAMSGRENKFIHMYNTGKNSTYTTLRSIARSKRI